MTKNHPLTCIVLSNYNGMKRGFLNDCLDALRTNLKRVNAKDPSYKLILIDDYSQDDSLGTFRQFREELPDQIDVLRTQNIDVTGCINRGICHVLENYPKCVFLVTFDNDTVISDNFLETITAKAQSSNKRTGMFASNQFMLADYPIKKQHRSTGHYITKAGAVFDRDFGDKVKNKNKEILCSCLSGGLLKIEMLENIGEFIPSEYTHYYNCPELGFRAQIAGWEVKFVPEAVMWHRRPPKDITYEQLRNRELARIWNILRFFPKNRIDEALESYLQESFCSSPKTEDKEGYIEKAKGNCPTFSCDEKKKAEIYKKFVKSHFNKL